MQIRVEQLGENNFTDYETITAKQSEGGCYCAFWHQKWTNMADWIQCQKETPERNRAIVYEKMRSGFHVGVLAYLENKLVAWISVGPLTDYYWTWKRVAQVGADAKTIAGITCFTIVPEFRGQGMQARILEALKEYGRTHGWAAIEGYPFDESAVEKYASEVIWPGMANGYAAAGFTRLEEHWLSNPEAERSVYRCELATAPAAQVG
ncbi:MAG: hypothetical protein JST22_02560 [Bacteroidetes bacterium]|nr:hypothetical protein [Bacteroidota bacterium]